MTRKCVNWIDSFIEYASFGEAPKFVYFFVAASTIAGALRRRVWIDQKHFQWFPNLYTVLVAPPGIISKSTTVDIGINLLRQVPNIRFGPAVITWQALVQSFAAASEAFEHEGLWQTMSPMTISSSEFGNFLNPQDKEMVDMLVNLWDGRSFDKKTKYSGDDSVVNPWINLITCTTPEWIAGSFPEYMIGGGFASRCMWVYADAKEKYVAYPALVAPTNLEELRDKLIHDLEWISLKLCGTYVLDEEALKWGTAWYEEHYRIHAVHFDASRYGGYVARKQTHMHKLAMIIAAAERDELVITKEDLENASSMLHTMEGDMPKVFDRIGTNPMAGHIQRLERRIHLDGKLAHRHALRLLLPHFTRASEIEDAIEALLAAGSIRKIVEGNEYWLVSNLGVEK